MRHRCLGNTFNDGFAIVVENDVVVCCCCGVVGLLINNDVL